LSTGGRTRRHPGGVREGGRVHQTRYARSDPRVLREGHQPAGVGAGAEVHDPVGGGGGDAAGVEDALGDKGGLLGSTTGGVESITVDVRVGDDDLPVRILRVMGAMKVTVDFEEFAPRPR
jgi:hypothetical protein